MKVPRHWPLCGEFTGDRWIPRTNGQLHGKCFHLMTSSWADNEPWSRSGRRLSLTLTANKRLGFQSNLAKHMGNGHDFWMVYCGTRNILYEFTCYYSLCIFVQHSSVWWLIKLHHPTPFWIYIYKWIENVNIISLLMSIYTFHMKRDKIHRSLKRQRLFRPNREVWGLLWMCLRNRCSVTRVDSTMSDKNGLIQYITWLITVYIHICYQRTYNEIFRQSAWWRHQMEIFSVLLAICAGNSPVSGEFPVQMPVTRSFDVFFDLRLHKRLSKQSWGWWFETPPCSLWHHSNGRSFMWCFLIST